MTRPALLQTVAGCGLTLALALFVLAARSPELDHALLLALLFWVGLALGAVGLLALGHLMGEVWLKPVRAELEAAARALPGAALLAIPVVVHPEMLQPAAGTALTGIQALWLEPDFLRVRLVGYFVLWTALAFWLARTGEHGARGALALVLLVPSIVLAAIDLILAREAAWWANLTGMSFALTQLLGALAASLAFTLARAGDPEPERARAVSRALMLLAILALWTQFMQFLIVWSANVPREVEWYVSRSPLGVGIQAWIGVAPLLAAIALLLPPRAGTARMLSAAGLILVNHLLHMFWLLRPDGQPYSWALDLAVMAAGGLAFALLFAAGLGRRESLVRRGEAIA